MAAIKIGLFGFGVVGEGIYKVLKDKPHLGVTVQKVVIKDKLKTRNAPHELFSTDPNAILEDPSINLVVELINDDVAAYSIVKKAFEHGKSVISANKKMIAAHHIELVELSQKHHVSFLYEAAVCGSIPIIRNLEEYFDNDLLTSISGIINGSTNYILSQMTHQALPFNTVLKTAQEQGFAESDPTLDIEGFDAADKLSIISVHAFGKQIESARIIRKGITALHPNDMQYAKEKGLTIKLIAKTFCNTNGLLDGLSVLPTFINQSDSLGQTNNEYNGVLIASTLADEQFFYGKGAGRYPTSSAVLSDISAYTYGYKYAYKKGIETYNPNYDGHGKFYISYDKTTTIDDHIFTEIDEKFESKNRHYLIGKISYQHLIKANLLNNPSISLISFN